jgi:hypothetical protein
LLGGDGRGQPSTLPESLAMREMGMLARIDALRQLKAVIVPFYVRLTDHQKKTADVLMLTILGAM